jgi:MoaA/NifB/PqqE/SkfB family radical SAM enzyme
MVKLLAAGWRYARANHRLGPPLQVGFAVNNTCNTFCEMCTIWRERPKEMLDLDQIRGIFGHRLFRHCATVSLTGGEPSLRRDLTDIPPLLAGMMPALRQINLTSNGFATDQIVGSLESFLPVLGDRGVGFSINLSMDGVGAVHDRVRNNPKAWERLDATVQALVTLRRRLPFNLVLACTFTRSNVEDAENILAYARAKGIYVIFRRAFTIDRIGSAEGYDQFAPTAEQDEELKRFFTRLRESYDRSHSRSLYYGMLLEMLQGSERTIPCLYRKAGLFVDHRGDLFVCTVFSRRLGSALTEDPEALYFASAEHRDELACGACRGCSHDVTLYTPLLDQARDRIKASITRVRR